MSAAERAWALMYEFVAANRRGEIAKELGFRIGAGRGKVLFRLRRGPMTLTEIAEHIGADAPYTTTIVDKLEAQGFVERRPHPEDRRRKLVTLTAAGQEAVAAANAAWRRPPAALAALPEQDLETLAEIFGRLVPDQEAPSAD